MKRIASLAAINAVELRLFQSRREILQSVDRTHSALRAAVVRPSTLMFVAVASGISSFFVSGRRCSSVESIANGASSAVRAPSPGIVRAFVSAYGAQVLGFLLQHVTAAWQQSGARDNADTQDNSATGNATTTAHDDSGSGPLGVG